MNHELEHTVEDARVKSLDSWDLDWELFWWDSRHWMDHEGCNYISFVINKMLKSITN